MVQPGCRPRCPRPVIDICRNLGLSVNPKQVEAVVVGRAQPRGQQPPARGARCRAAPFVAVERRLFECRRAEHAVDVAGEWIFRPHIQCSHDRFPFLIAMVRNTYSSMGHTVRITSESDIKTTAFARPVNQVRDRLGAAQLRSKKPRSSPLKRGIPIRNESWPSDDGSRTKWVGTALCSKAWAMADCSSIANNMSLSTPSTSTCARTACSAAAKLPPCSARSKRSIALDRYR